MDASSFAAPLAHLPDRLLSDRDISETLSLRIAAVQEVIAGSAATAWTGGAFRREGFAGTEYTAITRRVQR